MTITEQPETATGPAIDFGDVQAAAERLRGVAHRTPVLTSRTLDAMTGARVYLKAEPFQRIGAFKFRGAYNAISALEPETRVRGVVTNSSGNHAQAVALSAQIFGIPATIVMPTDAPPAKIAATRGYGAEIVFYDRYKEDRAAIAERVAADLGATMIPPYDHPLVMAGNGTTALELIEEVGELDLLLVCLGGGGLLSGCATAAKALSPGRRHLGGRAGRGRRLGAVVRQRRTCAPGRGAAHDRGRPADRGARGAHLAHGTAAGHGDRHCQRRRDSRCDALPLRAPEARHGAERRLGARRIADRQGRSRGKRVGVTISGGNIGLDGFCQIINQRDG